MDPSDETIYGYHTHSESAGTWSLGGSEMDSWPLMEPHYSAPQAIQHPDNMHSTYQHPYTEQWRRTEPHELHWSNQQVPQGVPAYDPYQASMLLPPHTMMPPSHLLPLHCYEEAYHPPMAPLPLAPVRKQRKKETMVEPSAVARRLCPIPQLDTEIRYGCTTFHHLQVAANVLETYRPWFWMEPVVADKRYEHLNAWYDPSSPAPSVPREYCLEDGTTVHKPALALFSTERNVVPAPLSMPASTVPSTLVTKPFLTSSTLKVRCWAIGNRCRLSEAFAREIASQMEEQGSFGIEMPTSSENLELVFHHAKKHLLIQSVCGDRKCKHSFGYSDIARLIIYDVYIKGSGKSLVGITIAVTERGDDSFKDFPNRSDEDAAPCNCAPIMPYFNRPLSKSVGTHPDFTSVHKHAGEFYITVVMDRSYFVLNQRGSSGCSPMARMILGDPYLASITMVKMIDRGIGMDKLEYRATSLWELRDRFACILELVYRSLKEYGPGQLSLLINPKLHHTFQVPYCIRPCCVGSRFADSSPRYDDEASDSTTVGANMSPSMDDEHPEPIDVRMKYLDPELEGSDIGDGEMTDDDDYVVRSENLDEFGDDDDGMYDRRKPRRGNPKKRKAPSNRIADADHDKTMRKRKAAGRSKKSKPKREPAMGAAPEETFAFNFLDIAAIAQLKGIEIMSKTEAMYFMEVTHIGSPGICNYRREYAQLAKDGHITMPIMAENNIDTSKLMPVADWDKQFVGKPELLANLRRADSPRTAKAAESPSCPLSTLDESICTEEEEANKKPSVNTKKKTKSSHIRVAVLLNKSALIKVFGPLVARLWTDFEKPSSA